MTGRALAIVLVFALAACQRDDAELAAPTAVKLAAVRHGGMPAGTHYSAQIIPATTIQLAFKVGGYVDAIAKQPGIDGRPRTMQEGDAVREGTVLATLRKSDFQHQLAAARAGRAQAAALAHQARVEWGRTRTLADHDAIAGAEVDSTRTQLDTAVAALSGAQARYEQAKTALVDATLASPIDGVVLARHVEQGELVAPGAVAFVVADVSSVKAQFGVPDTMVAKIALGMAESVTTDAYPDESFAGTITLIAPSADPHSRVFEVDVTIPNPEGRLKTGSVASLALGATGGHDALLVPISAIVRSPTHPDKLAVFVIDEQPGGRPRARAREVELDDYLGRDVPVKAGLRDGERIIVQGAKLVADGEPVEVLP
jgi:RND family efflux transporter MFP subunit